METICVRAVKVQELAVVRQLYEGLGRDGLWALDEENCPLEVLAEGGQVLGAFGSDGRLAAACPVVSWQSSLPQARAMAANVKGMAQPGTPLALPMAWAAGERGQAALCALGAALGKKGAVCALAVKPTLADAAPLAALLKAGCAVGRVRPLCALRPHYLLAAKAPVLDEGRIIVLYWDTRGLGRLLEDGYWADGCQGKGHDMKLTLARPAAVDPGKKP